MIKKTKYDPKEPHIYFISDIKDAKAIANHYLKRWRANSRWLFEPAIVHDVLL